MEKCPICGEAQITCINPECKAPIKKTMDVCEKCQTPQQLSQEPPPPSMEVQILCINPKCKAPLDSENYETCKKCDTPQRERHPPTSQPQTTVACSNPGCDETLDGSGESDLCSKCSVLQKQAQQSMDTQVVAARVHVCVNPKCRAPLPNKEDKVCNKCEALQTLCINPKCKQPLFTLNQGMCHECHISQKPDQQISNSSITGKTAGGGPDKNADSAPQPSSTPMETENSTTPATPQKSTSSESSVDKINPTTTTKSDTVTSSKDATSSKAKEKKENANTSQGTKVAAGSEKSGQPPPPTDSTLTLTDKAAKPKSNASSRQSSKSSMTSDSEESSDSDEFTTSPASATETITDHTDPKGDNKCTSDRAGATNVAMSQINLTRLTLDDTKSCKHDRDHDETEESSSSKRRVLEGDEVSPKVIKTDKTAKIKKPGTEKKSADEHKGSGQKLESSGAQGEGGTGSTQEVYTI
jgi:hypothetical protein